MCSIWHVVYFDFVTGLHQVLTLPLVLNVEQAYMGSQANPITDNHRFKYSDFIQPIIKWVLTVLGPKAYIAIEVG